MSIVRFLLLIALASGLMNVARADIAQDAALQKARAVLRASGVKSDLQLTGVERRNHGLPVRLLGPAGDLWSAVENDPRMLCYSFHFEPPEDTGQAKTLEVKAGAKGKNQDHEEATVDISIRDGRLINYNWVHHVLNLAAPARSTEAYRKKALDWMKTIAQPLPEGMFLYNTVDAGSDAWSFSWRRRGQSADAPVMLTPYIDVTVNSATGSITGYNVLDYDVTMTSFAHKIALDAAKTIARNGVAQHRDGEVSGGEAGDFDQALLTLWTYPAYADHPAQQRLSWEVRFKNGKAKSQQLTGEAAAEEPADWTVHIDADSGQVDSCEVHINGRP